MAKQRGRESNTGLVVTLVFFILISIGLGVATYYGFAQQADLTAKATTAENNEKDALAQRDWYRFQAWTFRTYLGQTENIDDAQLKVDRDKFDANQMGKDSKGDFKDRGDVVTVIKNVEEKKYKIAKEDKNKALVLQDVTMAWDKDTKRPKVTYPDVYKGLYSVGDYYEQQATAAATAEAKAEAEKKQSDDELDKARKEYAKQEADLTQQNNETLKKADAENAKLRDDLIAANKDYGEKLQANEDKVKVKQKEITAKDQKVQELEGKLGDLQERVEVASKSATDAPTNGKAIPTDWKIVKMDPSGKKPFINVGLADNIKPGLTFSIHGRGPDGRPLAASKGTLEVLNVLNDHLAQAQIAIPKDADKKDELARNPILEGDYLYNPIFRPGAEQHVVVAGRIDMHGNRLGDDLEEFERLLKRQNVTVDGYVDPQDGSIKGKLTVGTDYLVLGDIDATKDAAAAESIKHLQDLARSNGVRIISAREFLDSMGYRTP